MLQLLQGVATWGTPQEKQVFTCPWEMQRVRFLMLLPEPFLHWPYDTYL